MADGGLPQDRSSMWVPVLVITAEPDQRASTKQLKDLYAQAAGRLDMDLDVWFLRDYQKERWPGTRNVDDLRTWWANRLLEGVGLSMAAGWLRGRRLRKWFAAARPLLVVLDDGLGDRLLSAAPFVPLVAIRQNRVAGNDHGFEPPPRERADVAISYLREPDWAVGARRWVHASPLLDDLDDVVAMGRRAKATGRARAGVPEGVPLVVGWGEDGWVDGADLFVRTLWYLEDRHGIEAHGLWLTSSTDEHEQARLRRDAQRCGLEDRYHLVVDDDPELRWCGDVVHLPCRVRVDWFTLASAAACDQSIVTFAPTEAGGAWIREVPFLDLAAAALELATALEEGPQTWSAEVDRGRFLDNLVAVVQELWDT